jgi:hypothetical protein
MSLLCSFGTETYYREPLPTSQHPLRCQRCLLGIDDDCDGNCGVCVGLTEQQVVKVRKAVGRL